MSSNYIPVGMTLKGLSTSPVDVMVRNVSDTSESSGLANGGSTGFVVQFDMNAVVSAETTNFRNGVDTSGFVNVIRPEAGSVQNGAFYAILLEDIAPGASGLARVFGHVRAGHSGALALGDNLSTNTAGTSDGLVQSGLSHLVLAKGCEAVAGSSSDGLVFFDGFGTFGITAAI